MRLFDEPPQRRRIAAFASYEYPIAGDQRVYEQLDALQEQLNATVRAVHSVVPDPANTDVSLRPRIGSGLLVVSDNELQCNDVEHLRATLPVAFDNACRQLAELAHTSAPALIAKPEMQAACSGTRWLRAWQPDLIVSVGFTEHSLQSLLASQLLDVPRLLILNESLPDTQLLVLLPLFAQQARWILVPTEALRDELVAHLGQAIRDKVFVRSAPNALPSPLATRIAVQLDKPRTPEQPQLGPMAALLTRPERCAVTHSSVRPMLVLGTERTGSNLLVEMLAQHKQIRLANEVFNPQLIERDVVHWNGRPEVHREQVLRLRHANPAKLLSMLLQEGEELGASYAGFKLLYGHGLVDDRVVDMLYSRDDLRVVHLLREQRLERYASFARANATDNWRSLPGKHAAPAGPMHLDLRKMLQSFIQTEQFEARYRALFASHQVFEFDYRDLDRNRRQTLARLGEWLQLDLSQLAARSVKTGPRDLREGIANWQDVQQALKATAWSHLTEAQP